MVAAAAAGVARGREDLEQSLADALARHLDQTQRGDLGDLVLGAVPAEALHEPTQDEVAVGLQDHVDEVHDDDAADVAQPELTHDLLGRLQVVLGDGLLEVATLADELAGVDVDDRHRFGAIDDERATGRQPYLAIECLGELLLDAERSEDILAVRPGLHACGKVGSVRVDVGADVCGHAGSGDDELGEVLVEDIADDLDGEIRLSAELGRGLGRGRRLLDLFPLRLETLHVAREFFFAGTLRGRADDDAGALGHDLLEDALESSALGVGELARDARHGAIGHVDEIAARQ